MQPVFVCDRRAMFGTYYGQGLDGPSQLPDNANANLQRVKYDTLGE